MDSISDSELHGIVQRVIKRTMGLGDLPQPQSVPVVTPQAAPAAAPAPTSAGKTIAIGSDHGGYNLKEMLKKYLQELGYSITDLGTADSKTAVDYPDFAKAVAEQVGSGKVWRGIVVDGAGIGSCMVANKIAGVRAAMCYDYATAVNSREHNDANVLSLGSGLLGENLVKQIVKTWLETAFAGGRHQPRVDKIIALDQFIKKDGK
ncbi:MAG: ribose 5-phosphate isomerase B [Anaerolineaceae bacterium]